MTQTNISNSGTRHDSLSALYNAGYTMLFNSPEFVIFFVVIYFLYLVLSFRFQNILLLLASYFFYGWWDPRFLFLVALSTTVDYWVGLVLDRGRLTTNQKLLPAFFLCMCGFLFLCVNVSGVIEAIYNRSSSNFFRSEHVILVVCCSILMFIFALLFIYKFVEGKHTQRARLLVLSVSLTTQLGLLAVFKYFNFFADNLQVLMNKSGIYTGGLTSLSIVLPVGISFYTFQSLSYTIDIYRRQFKPTDSFLDFSLFVAYFPQLQAGPIERGRQLIPQLARPRKITAEQCLNGLFLILLGFFKKTAIADGVAPVVDQVFGSTGRVSWIDIVAGTVLFAFQIYCDFSGYIDIARGVSKLMGIELVSNFDHPYFSTNAREFWRRWNISLSKWLRDYLYISLGGAAGNLLYICRNLMATMLLGGLWHGAAWNFVLWGFYQGTLLCVHRVWAEFRGPDNIAARGSALILRHVGANVVFFLFVCYGWLIFRAHSFSQIVNFTWTLFADFGDFDYGAGTPRLSSLIGIAILVALEISQFSSGDEYVYRKLWAPFRGLLLAALVVTIMMGMSNDPAQFIYFKF